MEKEMSPLLMKADTSTIPVEPVDDTDETASESLDGGEPAGKQELVSWLASQPKLNARSKSGYILFSAEIRKRIMHENPEAGFGEVSKIVGIEWKKLSEEQKKQYEVRAEYIATERAKQEAREPQQFRLQPGQIRVFMCKWQTCDFQFDTVDGLYEHIKTAHTSQIVDGENQYVCLWASCLKYRKEGKPFPSLPRLHRHIKEKHLNSSAKSIYLNQRSKNYYSCQQSSSGTSTTPSIPVTTYIAVQQTTSNGQQQYAISPSPVAGYVAQAVVTPSNQVVTNGFVNGAAGTYVATPASAAVLHSSGNVQAYHPYPQQIRQVTTVAQPLIGGAGSQYTTVTVQPVGYGIPSTSQQQPQSLQQSTTLIPQAALISDPGRSVVQASRLPEPIFVAPPSSIQVKRVLHSEAYLRYIESLHCGSQRTVSKWNKSMLANRRNTTTHKTLPLNWLKEAQENGVKEDELINALWRLRDHLMQDVANISPQIGSL
uniref:HMG box domain-containing protein n=1 Tax=Syphacia muris TaxID=451379 RepID=A0A0N5AB24_9BILA